MLISLLAWASAAYAVYLLLTLLVTHSKRAAAAKARGCLPAPTFPSPDPAGIANVVQLIAANNKGRLLNYDVDRLETMTKQEGRHVFTFQTHIMRNWLFFTSDPKNVQALLATQFKDFELGPIRFGTFAPLCVFPRAPFLANRQAGRRHIFGGRQAVGARSRPSSAAVRSRASQRPRPGGAPSPKPSSRGADQRRRLVRARRPAAAELSVDHGLRV